MPICKPSALFAWALLVVASRVVSAQTPAVPTPPALPGTSKSGGANGSSTGKVPENKPGSQGGGDSKSAAGSAMANKESAAGDEKRLTALDPASPPAKVFARPRIGLALGGGGALALSEVGVLQWFEENHIPVDVVAGTSMGCMVSALYSTGLTPAELAHVMDDKVFAQVFSFSNSYQSRSFRRREDSRELPNAINIGLKHGVSFRNAVLTDQGLNAFLDRHFLRYDDQTDFNTLPIPLRCVSTDLNEARFVTFSRGSIPDAIRASVSLPGIFQPFELDGHEYVDGGVLDNLPTSTVHQMQADVVLAVSLPLQPVGKGDLNSLLGVLGRSFSVAIEGAEREQRKSANVVVMPDLKGFGATDYLKTADLAKRGYAAAAANAAALLQYSLSDADWAAYLVHRASLRRGPAGPVLRVRVAAPNASAERAVQAIFAPLVNRPVDTAKIEALLDQVRSDGRYEADYTVGYETEQQFHQQQAGQKALPQGTVAEQVATNVNQLPPSATEPSKKGSEEKGAGAAIAKPGTGDTSDQPGMAKTAGATVTTQLADAPTAAGMARTQDLSTQSLANIAARPVILVTVSEKKTGPPNLLLGANVQAQAGGLTHATVEGILLDQDLGGYGAELRTHFALGYMTEISSEYFRPVGLFRTPQHTFFVAPRGGLVRKPFAIYRDDIHISDRELQTVNVGGDVGWTNQRTQEVRAGIDFTHVGWNRIIGTDLLPDVFGTSQRARVMYNFDTQDRALVPQFGVHARIEGAYLYDTVASPNAPQISGNVSYAHRFKAFDPASDAIDKATHQPKEDKGRNIFIVAGEFGTEFNRNVAEPFRFTLGGPVRLSASSIDQYRGTDYWLVEPAILRRLAQLPQPLGQSFYLGFGLAGAQIYSPTAPTINRADAFLGIVAETPLGVITLAPSVGTNGERKFIFTLGKLF